MEQVEAKSQLEVIVEEIIQELEPIKSPSHELRRKSKDPWNIDTSNSTVKRFIAPKNTSQIFEYRHWDFEFETNDGNINRVKGLQHLMYIQDAIQLFAKIRSKFEQRARQSKMAATEALEITSETAIRVKEAI